jgi:hypothetical protein
MAGALNLAGLPANPLRGKKDATDDGDLIEWELFRITAAGGPPQKGAGKIRSAPPLMEKSRAKRLATSSVKAN